MFKNVCNVCVTTLNVSFYCLKMFARACMYWSVRRFLEERRCDSVFRTERSRSWTFPCAWMIPRNVFRFPVAVEERAEEEEEEEEGGWTFPMNVKKRRRNRTDSFWVQRFCDVRVTFSSARARNVLRQTRKRFSVWTLREFSCYRSIRGFCICLLNLSSCDRGGLGSCCGS